MKADTCCAVVCSVVEVWCGVRRGGGGRVEALRAHVCYTYMLLCLPRKRPVPGCSGGAPLEEGKHSTTPWYHPQSRVVCRGVVCGGAHCRGWLLLCGTDR